MGLGVQVKALLRRPLTYSDLVSAAAGLISRPPLPPDWYELAVSWVGPTEVSLLDYWRTQYQAALKQIAQEPTWDTQRALLLRMALAQSSWRAVKRASNQARHSSSWAHLVEDHEAFAHLDAADQERRSLMLTQVWLLAVMSLAALLGVGFKIYALGTRKDREIDLYGDFDSEIKCLDVSSMDLVADAIADGDDGTVARLVDLKDNGFNPLIDEQYRLLRRMADDIVHRSLDVPVVRKGLAEIQRRKHALASTIGHQE